MKKLISVLSAVLLLCAALPFAPAAAQTYNSYTKEHDTEYCYASGTQFIYQLGLYYSSSSDADAEQHILDAGFTPFGGDFNAGGGGKYVHAGYKTTSDPARAAKALRIWHASNDPTSASSFINGSTCTFYQVGSGAHTLTPNVMDGMVGLNKGNGGDNLELFVTQDHDAGPAVTALSMANHKKAATAQSVLLDFGYTIATSFQNVTVAQDLNAGAGSGTDYNYVGYRSSCAVVVSDALRAAYQAAKACNERGVTDAALTNALNAASAILADLNDGYTTRTQAQIDSAAGSLTAALPDGVQIYADYPAPTMTEYYYPAGTEFFGQLALTASDAADSTAEQDLRRMGFTPFGQSFNANVAGSDIRGGYKTTTDPAQAVTALRVRRGADSPDVAASAINGKTCYFYQIGSGASAMTPDTFGKIDLNRGNSGDDLRLFATNDPAAGPPLTAVSMNKLILNLTQYGYTVSDSFHSPGTPQDLNAGVGSTGNFIGWKSVCTAVDSTALRAAYAETKLAYERCGYTWIREALDPAAVILDDLRDGYTTYTQAQIDAASDMLSSTDSSFIVELGLDSSVPQVSSTFDSTESFRSDPKEIAASRTEARPLQFYYTDDGGIGFYLPNSYFPNTYRVIEHFAFDGWKLKQDSSDNPEYLTLTQAKTVLLPKVTFNPTVATRVPTEITLTYGETQTSFDFIVDSCKGVSCEEANDWDLIFEFSDSFRATLYDGVLTGPDASETLAYTMTTTGAHSEINSSSVSFGVTGGTYAPYICSGIINIDANALADAAPGTYIGSLQWSWSDAGDTSGSGAIPLTLIVPPLSAEEQAAVDSVIALINAIGTVEYTAESKARIDAARDAYDALTGRQRSQVTVLGTLTDAEADYEELKSIWIETHFLTLKPGASIVLDRVRGIVCGLPPACGADALRAQFTNDSSEIVFAPDSGVVSTGSVIRLMDGDTVLDELTAVLFGDVNGDGRYDGTDAYFVQLVAGGLIGESALTAAQQTAADCNHDGAIDSADVSLLERAGLLLAQIDQTLPSEGAQPNSLYLEYCALIDQSIEIDSSERPTAAEEPAADRESAPTVRQMILDLFRRVADLITMIFSIIVTPK